MNDTVLVSIVQSKTDLDNDRDCITPVKVTVLVDEIFYGDAFDVFLNDISEITFVAYAVNFNDISVIKRCNGLSLSIESSNELLIG